jgi:hypothetical protein
MTLTGKENDRNSGGDRKEAVGLRKFTVIIVKIVIVCLLYLLILYWQ